MYYIVRCTYVEMYISDLKKNLSKMFHKYSELYLLTSSPQAGTARKARRDSTCRRSESYTMYHYRCTALQAAPREGYSGDF
jgi:hypothetical protein